VAALAVQRATAPGLRRYVAMSVSSEADPEGGEGSAGVAGVAAQRGGDVDRPCPTELADDQVAQGRHDVWVAPVRTWEPSSAKVVSRRWCSASIAQCPQMRSASRARPAWAWVRLVMA
jgi:hypothetical protein